MTYLHGFDTGQRKSGNTTSNTKTMLGEPDILTRSFWATGNQSENPMLFVMFYKRLEAFFSKDNCKDMSYLMTYASQ